MDLDIVERARAGDRDAFRALVALWGDRLLRTAVLLDGTRAGAERALGAAFARAWTGLPALHSERAFRPWLFGRVLETVLEKPPRDGEEETEPPPPHRACLRGLDPQARALVVLHLYDDVGAAELALVRGVNIGAAMRDLRRALRALGACLEPAGLSEDAVRGLLREDVRGVEVPAWYYDEAIATRLAEPDALTVRRHLRVEPARAWAVCVDAAVLPAWTGAPDVRARGGSLLEPGTRILATGRVAGERASRDTSLVTRAGDDRVLGWTTRSRVRPYPSAIEFRWTIDVAGAPGGCELVHRLRGVAFPAGPTGRALRHAYERVADRMQTSMHAGIERLAQTIEVRAARAPL